MDLAALAFVAGIAVQEGNPCQASVTASANNPNQIAYHIQDIDKSGVTNIEYVTFLKGNNEPQDRVKIPRIQLQSTPFINCHVMSWNPPAHLTRDGKTEYVVVARTENVKMLASAWSEPSNPFTLGVVPNPNPEPIPPPVPGVRVGSSTTP